MKQKMTLAGYVAKRNGVPLGDPSSLANMLNHSLGASSFAQFWLYWNPIWGFYLSRYVMKPLSRIFPHWLAVIFTFSVSGLIHDFAVLLIKWQLSYLLTVWFTFMGVIVALSSGFKLSYVKQAWWLRAIINLTLIAMSLIFSLLVTA